MTAREYLSQAYRIDQRINSKIEQVASLRDLSFKATATLTDMPGGSRNVHSKESIVAKMMDLENEINADIDNLVDIKRDVVSMINSVDNKDCQLLLEMRYLRFMPWERIAIEMQRSLRSIYRLHDKALEKISQKIKVGS
ncbi:MAG: DUF1492 domain-containing protein [Candidatus Ornithomonoglobus sp.]